ncbi:MAG: hypothetical protein ABII01_03070 [Candidatus Woesearchaeota archaeon]
MYTIELVCSGDHDRAPVGMLFLNQLFRISYLNGHQAISSGSRVNDFRTGNILISEKVSYVYMGKGECILSREEEQWLESEKPLSEETAHSLYFIATENLLRIAKERRAQALRTLGFDPTQLKQNRDQFVPREDVDEIWCFGTKNSDNVREAYRRSELKQPPQRIIQIEDPFCGSVDEYVETYIKMWHEIRV